MSRLESNIHRMVAQRDILDMLCRNVAGMPGPIFELGLGNGRTYDHLRARLPGRRIVAFDRAVGSHPQSTPEPADMVLGDIRETAAAMAGAGGALVHADIGTAYPEKDAETIKWLPGVAAGLLAPGGLAASGLPLVHPDLEPLPLPEGIKPGRYWIYRRR